MIRADEFICKFVVLGAMVKPRKRLGNENNTKFSNLCVVAFKFVGEAVTKVSGESMIK